MRECIEFLIEICYQRRKAIKNQEHILILFLLRLVKNETVMMTYLKPFQVYLKEC